jgi:competence protein ComEA
MKKFAAIATALALAISGVAFAQKAEPAKAPPAPAAKEAPKAELIDINSADKKTLMTLKGVGDVTADKIIANRGKSGYSGKDDLVKKKIITDKVYAEIKDQIIAKQAKK